MTKQTSLAAVSLALAIGLGGPGCAGVECAEGTVLDGDHCVATLPAKCGPGTELDPSSGRCAPSDGGGVAVCGAGTHEENGECVANIAARGNMGRIKALQINDPPELGAGANDTLAGEFETGASLMFVGVYTPREDVWRIFTGKGTDTGEGSYDFDRTTATEAGATNTSSVLATEEFTFNIHALSATPIVLLDATISDAVVEEIDGIWMVTSGTFTGVLTETNADLVFIDLANAYLGQLIKGFGADPNHDYDGVGGNDSWIVSGTFETEPVWAF